MAKEQKKRTRQTYTQEIKQKACSMYLRGLHLDEISKILGVPVRTLEDWQNIEDWRKNKYPVELKKRAFDLRATGHKIYEIARILNLSISTTYRYIKGYRDSKN